MNNKTRVDTDAILLIMKKLSDVLVHYLRNTSITPNQITSSNFLIFGPLICYFFIQGGMRNNIIAFVFLVIHSFFDLVDGELARQKNMRSDLGAWLEDSLDNLLQTIVIFSIALNILTNYESSWKYLAILAILGQSLANIYGLRLTNLFKIDPLTGNEELHKYFEKKNGSMIDDFLRNMLVPTQFAYILIFTLRFYVVIGIMFNILPHLFIVFGVFITIRSIMIYMIITLFQTKNKNLMRFGTFKYLFTSYELKST